ncbi:MAG: SpaA isopeptide-forming pilin-related protein, partial [Anaerovoracaceae bacterium]
KAGDKSNTAMWNKLPSAAKTWIARAKLYGYGGGASFNPPGNGNDYRVATQYIIWELADGCRTSPTNRTNNRYYNLIKGSNAAKAYDDILTKMNRHTVGASFVKEDAASAKNNKYKLMHSYVKSGSSYKDSWSRTLTDSKKYTELKVVDKDGLSISKPTDWSFAVSSTSKVTSATAKFQHKGLDDSDADFLIAYSGGNQALAVGSNSSKEFFASFVTENAGAAKLIKTTTLKNGATYINDTINFEIRGISTNVNNYLKTVSLSIVEGTGRGELSVALYPGTYKITEKLSAEQAKKYNPEGSIREATVVVTEGGTATASFVNVLEDKGLQRLRILKFTDDGSSPAGFNFLLAGTLYDGKEVTESDVLNKTAAKVVAKATDTKTEEDTPNPGESTVTTVEYINPEAITVKSSDLKALNDGICEGEEKEFTLTLNSKITKKTTIKVLDGSGAELSKTESEDEMNLSETIKVDLKNQKAVAAKTLSGKIDGIVADDILLPNSASKMSKIVISNLFGIYEENPIEPGRYRVREILTAAQKLRYREPNPAFYDVDIPKVADPEADYSVSFENKAKRGKLELIKTSTDKIIGGISFKITGETDFGKILCSKISTVNEAAEVPSLAPKKLVPRKFNLDENEEEQTTIVPYLLTHTDEEGKISLGNGETIIIASPIKDGGGNIIGIDESTIEELAFLPPGKYRVEEALTDEQKLIYMPIPAHDITVLDEEEGFTESLNFANRNFGATRILKLSENTGEPLSGVRLRVIKKDTGAVIKEWITTGEEEEISDLVFGDTYLLQEVLPLPGYVKAEDIEFVAEASGNEIIMYNAPTNVYVSKLDALNDNLVAGAKFEIIDIETRKAVAKVKSTAEVPSAVEGLIEGRKYYIREVKAPTGYALPEGGDILFVAKNNGNVKVENRPYGWLKVLRSYGLNPNTGDGRVMLFSVLALIISGLGIAIASVRRRKQNV